MASLRSMFTMAMEIGNKTKIKSFKTETGVKDTYLDFFIDRAFASYKNKQGSQAKQVALSEFAVTLPHHVFSPVWRIKGMPIIKCLLT
jgi:hypothetical protein